MWGLLGTGRVQQEVSASVIRLSHPETVPSPTPSPGMVAGKVGDRRFNPP